MPYIIQEKRVKYREVLDKLPEINCKGELEYVIFKIMRKYMSSRDYKYNTLHDCVYAVAHCSDEFRRRYLDKREDVAIETNGDI